MIIINFGFAQSIDLEDYYLNDCARVMAILQDIDNDEKLYGVSPNVNLAILALAELYYTRILPNFLTSSDYLTDDEIAKINYNLTLLQ